MEMSRLLSNNRMVCTCSALQPLLALLIFKTSLGSIKMVMFKQSSNKMGWVCLVLPLPSNISLGSERMGKSTLSSNTKME